jgi:capsular exopolysaccharide synthesis family protein
MTLMFRPEFPSRLDLDPPSRVPLVLSAQTHGLPGDSEDLLRHVKSTSIAPPESGRLICVTDPESPAAEAFRLVAVRLREMRRERPLKKLLITSTIPQEGKSVVAANLACILSQGRQEKVLLLEGDIRRPTLSQKMGMEERAGLCEWISKDLSLAQSIVYLPEAKIWALPAGKANTNPLDILQSQRLSPLMTQLAGCFDWVIIDSPPLLPVADTSVWSALADGIVLVTRYGTTQKKELLRGIKQVDAKKVVGAVINCSKNLPHSEYYYRRSSSPRNSGR